MNIAGMHRSPVGLYLLTGMFFLLSAGLFVNEFSLIKNGNTAAGTVTGGGSNAARSVSFIGPEGKHVSVPLPFILSVAVRPAAGSTVTVYYDVDNPASTHIEAPGPVARRAWLFLPISSLCAGLFCIFITLRYIRTR